MSETETRETTRYERYAEAMGLGKGTGSAWAPIVQRAMDCADDELSRLRGVVEAVRALADAPFFAYPIAAVRALDLREALASVPSSGEGEDIEALIERSSLGTPEAKRLRASVSDESGEAESGEATLVDPANYGGANVYADPEGTVCLTCGRTATEHTGGRYGMYGTCPAPVVSGGQADGEGEALAAMLHTHAEQRRVHGPSAVADDLDWIARKVAALAARPVLSREAMQTRWVGMASTASPGRRWPASATTGPGSPFPSTPPTLPASSTPRRRDVADPTPDEVESLASLLPLGYEPRDGDANVFEAAGRILRSDWIAQHDARIRRETFAEVSRAMNRAADMWERDGSDPCRVRIGREYANAYRAYAEGFGEPTGSTVQP